MKGADVFIPEWLLGFAVGLMTGWASLVGLVYWAAKRQQKGNRRPK